MTFFFSLLVLFPVPSAPTLCSALPQSSKKSTETSGVPCLTNQSKPDLKILWATSALCAILCYSTYHTVFLFLHSLTLPFDSKPLESKEIVISLFQKKFLKVIFRERVRERDIYVQEKH